MADRSAPRIYVSVRPPNSSYEENVDQSARVLSLTFEDTEAKANKLVVHVDNYDLSQFDSPLWQPGNIIVFSFGYPGAMSPQREMPIQIVKGLNPLQVEAHGEEVLLNRRPRTDMHWEKMKRSDVVRLIAKSYGVTAEQLHIQDTKIIQDQITQACMTDYQLIKSLAYREGFQFSIDFDGWHFGKRDFAQAPLRTFTYFTSPGVGDIISVQIDDDRGAGKASAVTLAGRDTTKKESFEVTGDDDSTEGSTRLASDRTSYGSTDKPPQQKAEETIDAKTSTAAENAFAAPTVAQDRALATTELTKEAAQQRANGEYQERQQRSIGLTFTARGDGGTLSKSVVTMAGLGPKISGNYYLNEVKHAVGSGYTMTIKAKRDGHNAGGGGGSFPSTALPADGPQNEKGQADPSKLQEKQVEGIDADTASAGTVRLVATGGKGQ